MIDLYVLCRSDVYVKRWEKLAQHFPETRFHIRTGYSSYYRFIKDVLQQEGGPCILCHDDIWMGVGFFARIDRLIAELNASLANWGVAGNAGICPKGQIVYRYIRDPHGGPIKSASPKPVLGVDGNMMLLNRPALKRQNLNLPDPGGFHGYDIVLSLECLRVGLMPVADHRLMVFHESAGDGKSFAEFLRKPWIADYLRTHFINHAIPTINGQIDLHDTQDYGYLLADAKDDRQDVFALFDLALKASRARRRPSVTIFCRSMLERPALLSRAMQSFAVACEQAGALLDMRVVVITHKPKYELAQEIDRLSALLPALPLSGETYSVRAGRYSRTDLLIHAFEQCKSDYAWFVDDDDFIYPSAVTDIARHLAANGSSLLIGDTVRFDEQWEDTAANHSFLPLQMREHSRTQSQQVFVSYMHGDNFVPICGCIFPVGAMRGQLQGAHATGDYYEDFYLLMLAMSAPGVEIVTLSLLISGISLRGTENTVTEPDRSHWNFSYASFMGELLDLPQSGSPVFWQFARQHQPGSPTGPVTALMIQRMPRVVRYLTHVGYFLHAVRKIVKDPEILRIVWRKVVDVYRTQGLKALLVKFIHFGQR